MNQISAKEMPAKDLLSSYFFEIPGYQRPYSWDESHARELLSDLLGAWRDAAATEASNPAAPYFLGSVVLVVNEPSTSAQVIDGQQRLTTLAMILSTLRCLIQDESYGAEQLTPYLFDKGNPYVKQPPRYRLKLRSLDEEFFRDLVQVPGGMNALSPVLRETQENLVQEPKGDAQHRILDNCRALFQELCQLEEEELKSFAAYIVHHTFLVAVVTRNFESAFRIFGVMNSRGLSLSMVDLLKAELLGQLPPETRERYSKQWDDMEQSMGRESFEHLFRIIQQIELCKSAPLSLDHFKQQLQIKGPQSFFDNTFARTANAYETLTASLVQASTFGPSINRNLVWLNRLPSTAWLTPAIAYYLKNPAHHDLDIFFKQLLRLGVYLTVQSGRSRTGSNSVADTRYNSLLAQFKAGVAPMAPDSKLALDPGGQEHFVRILRHSFGALTAEARKIVLCLLDEHVSKAPLSVEFSSIEQDRVLPEDPPSASTWWVWVPDPEAYASLKDSLGNTALINRKKSTSLSRKSLSEKQLKYLSKNLSTPFKTTEPILDAKVWGAAEVGKRQDELVAAAIELWELNDRSVSAMHLDVYKSNPKFYELALGGAMSGLQAHGVQSSDSAQFIVLKGSRANSEMTKRGFYRLEHERLLANGALVPDADGRFLTFNDDITFDTKEIATSVVIGSNPIKTREYWKHPRIPRAPAR